MTMAMKHGTTHKREQKRGRLAQAVMQWLARQAAEDKQGFSCAMLKGLEFTLNTGSTKRF